MTFVHHLLNQCVTHFFTSVSNTKNCSGENGIHFLGKSNMLMADIAFKNSSYFWTIYLHITIYPGRNVTDKRYFVKLKKELSTVNNSGSRMLVTKKRNVNRKEIRAYFRLHNIRDNSVVWVCPVTKILQEDNFWIIHENILSHVFDI